MSIQKLFLFCIILILPFCISAQNFKIYSGFPSGNISVEKIQNDTIWMHPDLRDTKGDWFYWCFGVSNAKGKTLTFVFTRTNVFTSMGPAVSFNSGLTWNYLGGDKVRNETFSYTFNGSGEVRFSMGMPYTQKNFSLFIHPLLESKYLRLDTLEITKGGRAVERLIIIPPGKAPKYKVLITARHHACEMMANYEIEGIITEILNDSWLRINVEFCFIPFMDKDGVEKGDQGKNRLPRDHNRDYLGASIHESTNALRSWVPQWADSSLVITMDLHCPWINGENNENIYIVGSGESNFAEQEKIFCEKLKSSNRGKLKISDKIILPFGTAWNTGIPSSEGLSFSDWAFTIEGVRLNMSIEFPYANNEGQMISQQSAREFGEDLGRAMKKYLKKLQIQKY
jgi:hypothetical protein